MCVLRKTWCTNKLICWWPLIFVRPTQKAWRNSSLGLERSAATSFHRCAWWSRGDQGSQHAPGGFTHCFQEWKQFAFPFALSLRSGCLRRRRAFYFILRALSHFHAEYKICPRVCMHVLFLIRPGHGLFISFLSFLARRIKKAFLYNSTHPASITPVRISKRRRVEKKLKLLHQRRVAFRRRVSQASLWTLSLSSNLFFMQRIRSQLNKLFCEPETTGAVSICALLTRRGMARTRRRES